MTSLGVFGTILAVLWGLTLLTSAVIVVYILFFMDDDEQG